MLFPACETDAGADELKTLSVELQDLIQGKVGVTAFSAVYNQIRQGVLGVRRDRRTARVLQVSVASAVVRYCLANVASRKLSTPSSRPGGRRCAMTTRRTPGRGRQLRSGTSHYIAINRC